MNGKRSRRWILFVAMRHFHTKRREKGHTAGALSVLGIAAGVMTLIAVVGVMNGFQSGTIADILELNSYHLQVSTDDSEQLSSDLEQLSGVRTVTPFVDVFGLVLGFFQNPRAAMIRAVPGDTLVADEALSDVLELVSGSLHLDDEGGVILGEDLVSRLGVRVGDTVRVANFTDLSNNIARPYSVPLVVTGIFKSGYLEFDGGWGFVSLATAAELLAAGEPATVGVKLDDQFSDRQMAARIGQMPGAGTVVSWREYNRAIFGALRLEKTVMILLVGLIFVVVGVNIFQSLRRSVVERTEEIGVLKALGAGPAPLQLVFVVEGLWIGITGAVIGMMLGLLISANVNEVFGLVEAGINGVVSFADWLVSTLRPAGDSVSGPFTIFSPAYFYLDEVPSRVYFGEVLGIFLFAISSSAVAAFFASRRVSTITPAEVLRFE